MSEGVSEGVSGGDVSPNTGVCPAGLTASFYIDWAWEGGIGSVSVDSSSH